MQNNIALLIKITGLILLGVVGYHIAFYVTPPDVTIRIHPIQAGHYQFTIKPNFVVNHLQSVKIEDASGVYLHVGHPQQGKQTYPVFIPAAAGHPVTITCDLQYDRFVAAGTTVKKTIKLP
jgi:hypothetical protein